MSAKKTKSTDGSLPDMKTNSSTKQTNAEIQKLNEENEVINAPF